MLKISVLPVHVILFPTDLSFNEADLRRMVLKCAAEKFQFEEINLTITRLDTSEPDEFMQFITQTYHPAPYKPLGTYIAVLCSAPSFVAQMNQLLVLDPTPDNFRRFCLAEVAPLHYVFAYRAKFLEQIIDYLDGGGPRVAAIVFVDCLKNGYADLANEIEIGMKEIWPGLDWIYLGQMLDQLRILVLQKEDLTKAEVEPFLKEFLPPHHRVPDGFVFYFLDEDTYTRFFDRRQEMLEAYWAIGNPVAPTLAWIGCKLNGEIGERLASDLGELIEQKWPPLSPALIEAFLPGVAELRELYTPEIWDQKVTTWVMDATRSIIAEWDAEQD